MSARMAKRNRLADPKKPRILIVTPEITYLPEGMGNLAGQMSAKAGGMADVSASLVAALFDLGADVHVALPHYRRMFHEETAKLVAEELRVYKSRMPNERIHLAEDRCFYYRDHVYSRGDGNAKLSLAFQREVINNIMNTVQPDLIHCNDWMTGLIPAAARREGIPCLFTVHNIHTHKMTLSQVEDAGIDGAEFWSNLYYSRPPYNYEESRNTNPIDLQASGVFAAHYINTVSPTFLQEIVNGWHGFIPDSIRNEIRNKYYAGCAAGILNAPDPTDNPILDDKIPFRYGPENHAENKRKNKLALQHALGLEENPDAPVFFWPSRLDPVQKGNFDGRLSQLGFAGSDFMVMPSLFEPCGLPQMQAPIYGSLAIAHNTGGLHDTVEMLDAANHRGNGFIFDNYDSNGLFWAMDRAMDFWRMPRDLRDAEITRIMAESLHRFNHEACAQRYIELYEKMLNRPLVLDD